MKRRPHPGHAWFGAIERPDHSVAITRSRCVGVRPVVAAFEDHTQVSTVRCYYGDETGRCARLLMFDPGDGVDGFQEVDLQGWRCQEADNGGFAKDRVWSCPQHG